MDECVPSLQFWPELINLNPKKAFNDVWLLATYILLSWCSVEFQLAWSPLQSEAKWRNQKYANNNIRQKQRLQKIKIEHKNTNPILISSINTRYYNCHFALFIHLLSVRFSWVVKYVIQPRNKLSYVSFKSASPGYLQILHLLEENYCNFKFKCSISKQCRKYQSSCLLILT